MINKQNKKLSDMKSTKIAFDKLAAIRQQIETLNAELAAQTQIVVESASSDFQAELDKLSDTIKKSFTKTKLIPTQFGFIVTSPDFKNTSGATEIRQMINNTANHKSFVNAKVTEWYANVNSPKVVKITLTKGYIQSCNPEYKNILADITID
jgi:hypothetical protein